MWIYYVFSIILIIIFLLVVYIILNKIYRIFRPNDGTEEPNPAPEPIMFSKQVAVKKPMKKPYGDIHAKTAKK